MKLIHAFFLSVPLVTAALTESRVAEACGGCAPPQGESTQVTGHRMIFSVGKTQTTLYDQIEYSGEPSSFAWILPIKGQVEIGLSSDALFGVLSENTSINVSPPPLNCPPPPSCWDWAGEGVGTGASGGGGADGGGVTVIAQEVVGPYDTVQLASTDPAALKNWLTANNYNIDADVSPIIDAYVNEGFDFLALKLVPGQGVNSMKPVRVTTPGSSVTLPLRMVAAGTGAITPLTLWVLGEGRYEAKNFPSFEIDPAEIVWDWDTWSSNYATLKADGFAAGKNGNWLTQYARPFSPFTIRNRLEQLVWILPDQSGYGTSADDWATAEQELQADLDTLFGGGLNQSALWITRLNAELGREWLTKDLGIGAANAQDQVSNWFQATQAIGKAPSCPQYSPCDSNTGNNNNGSDGPWWSNFGDGNANGKSSSSGCAVSTSAQSTAAIGFMGIALGLSVARRRRRKS